MVMVLLHTELDRLKSHLSKRMCEHIRNWQVSRFECYEHNNLISFDWYDINKSAEYPTQIIIYIDKENLFFLCEDERGLAHVTKLIASIDLPVVRILYSFFSELIKGDINRLEEFEEAITATEDELLTSSKKGCAAEIIAYRRELLRFKKYYEQLNQIFEEFIENEIGLIPKEDLRYFRILDSKLDRLFSHVLNLRDYVTQVREAYQAQIDIEQNSLMKVFTVVTAIFLPLTLIVGWYGMNLQMPEFSWKFGYLLVICVSIVVVVFCLVFFKRKKWF